MPIIRIPTPLRSYTDRQTRIIVRGDTVGKAMSDMVKQHPDLKEHLFKGDELRNFVNVFLGDEDIRFIDGMDTRLEEDDTLRIIPSVAGG